LNIDVLLLTFICPGFDKAGHMFFWLMDALTPVFLHKYMVKISSEYLITTCFFGCIVFKGDDCIEFLLIYFELKEE